MSRFKNLLRSRSFRAGGYSVLVCALALGIAMAVNYLASALPQGLTHRDVTENQLFSLSPQSESLLEGLDADVNVYWIVQSGQEDAGLEQLLASYTAHSDHLILEKRDPDVYPTFLDSYGVSQIYNNSLLVTQGSRYRYLSYDEIYVYDADSYYNTGTYTQTFAGEQKLTGAIQFVTSESLPKVYLTTGHGEQALPDSYTQAMEGANLESQQLSLLSSQAVPEDAAAVAILGADKDFAVEELTALEEYLMNGGKLLYVSAPMTGSRPEKLEALLSRYGLSAGEGVVVEGNSNYFALATPYYLMPDLESHSITQPLISGGYYVLLPIAQAVTIGSGLPDTVDVTSLLKTSSRAYAKLEGLTSSTYQKETGDLDGPFSLAAASELTLDDGLTSRLVWVGYTGILDEQADTRVSGGNQDFFLNALSWLAGQEDNISIHPKSLENEYLTMSDATANVLAVLVLAVIPGLTLAVGASIAIRRKRR